MIGSSEEIAVSGAIVDAAIAVHRTMGPGVFERIYAECLVAELGDRGLTVACEVPLRLRYKGRPLSAEYRIDLVVADLVVVEVKAIEKVKPLHRAQLLSYLRLSGHRIGLLLNFHSPLMKDGIHRIFEMDHARIGTDA